MFIKSLISALVLSISMLVPQVLLSSTTGEPSCCCCDQSKISVHYPNFSDNPTLSQEMREKMEPYLLPLDHHLKPILDSIFSKSRAIASKKALRRAGFTILFAQKKSFIIVAKHPKVSGYLFKIYTDRQNVHKDGMIGWELLTTRCAVAKKIRTLIERKNLRLFSVADKWLYPLPKKPTSRYSKPEPVILIVKDMNIYPYSESRKAWRKKATKELLRQLYAVLGRGYGSACLNKNIPYTKNGTFAYIDTEFGKRKVRLFRATRFFPKKLRPYWERRIQKSIPPSLSLS